MASNTESNQEWDVFIEHHFLGRVTAANQEEAIALGLRLYGSYLEGILRVERRAQTSQDGWSRPI